jgi:hypothetical protein
VYSLKVCELVVVCIDACAEEEPGVSAIDNLGLMLLVAGRDEAVDLFALSARGRKSTRVCGRNECAIGVRVVTRLWQEDSAYLALELHLLLVLHNVSSVLKITFN